MTASQSLFLKRELTTLFCGSNSFDDKLGNYEGRIVNEGTIHLYTLVRVSSISRKLDRVDRASINLVKGFLNVLQCNNDIMDWKLILKYVSSCCK